MSPADLISHHFRLKPEQKQALTKLKLNTLADLLFYFPTRYLSQADFKLISDLKPDMEVTLWVKVIKAQAKKSWHQKMPMTEAILADDSGKIKALWFHQAFLAKKLLANLTIKVSGRVSKRGSDLALINPEVSFEASPIWTDQTIFGNNQENEVQPIYPTTAGLSSGWFYYHIQKILAQKVQLKINDPLPQTLITRYHLPSLTTALIWLHRPKNNKQLTSAKKRIAFEEIFYLQLNRQLTRGEYKKQGAKKLKVDNKKIKEFIDRLPFKLTLAQGQAIKELQADLKQSQPMMRLLEGDVGSGKTAVAAVASFIAVSAGTEVAYMVPTEILARQHFESFIENFTHLGIQVGLLTGKECRKFPSKINPREHTHISRAQLLTWVKNGDIPIVIGTHALIQKSVVFKNLSLAIIDEQHRFGITQRQNLLKDKDDNQTAPHLLSMTATPIPRTLALTIFGDLDLSVLDELPPGRKKVITEIIPPTKRHQVYDKIRTEILAGRQAYVICPRIDEPDPEKSRALLVKSAKSEASRLQEKIFPEFTIGLVHSQLKTKDKDEEMNRFINGEINILVATSVVEVGVNVPNATIIIIEGAERFGLAQLHQLRGRVLRSSHQSHCFLFSDSNNQTSFTRLKALAKTTSGFKLAELDLKLRGTGPLSGQKQWGISDLGMEAIKNLKLVIAAKKEAEDLIKVDPKLKAYPELQLKITNLNTHLE